MMYFAKYANLLDFKTYAPLCHTTKALPTRNDYLSSRNPRIHTNNSNEKPIIESWLACNMALTG